MVTSNKVRISSTDIEKMNNFVLSYNKTIPNFFDENVCEIIPIQVQRGTIKVYHHKPEKTIAKRPIVFIPGFGTASITWRNFHASHHGDIEYYHIETRDKKSAKIRRGIKTNLSIDRIALDIAETIEQLGLNNNDYVLMGACMNGGVLLHGLIHNYFKPPTTIAMDPFTKWTQNRVFVKYFLPVLPPVIFGALKNIIGRSVMKNMTNEEQIKRNQANIDEAVAWKWRKFAITNVNLDINNELSKIKEEVIILHGPPDKYHPEGTFMKVAERIPKGRFFHMGVSNDIREIMVGVFATEFAKISKEDGIPKLLQPYEVELDRSSN
ncbi:MAG: alpha/beta hydrolase [Asgard group archaeon]|nr:alpha/beta hydrolase [Asgard group archaeon]